MKSPRYVLNQIDFWMLINHPLLWRTHVHYFLSYALVAYSLLLLLLLIVITTATGYELESFKGSIREEDLETFFTNHRALLNQTELIPVIMLVVPGMVILISLFLKIKQAPIFRIKQCWIVINGTTISCMCITSFIAVSMVLVEWISLSWTIPLFEAELTNPINELYSANRYMLHRLEFNVFLLAIPFGVFRFIIFNYIRISLKQTILLLIILFIVLVGYIAGFLLVVIGCIAFSMYKKDNMNNIKEKLTQSINIILTFTSLCLCVIVCMGLLSFPSLTYSSGFFNKMTISEAWWLSLGLLGFFIITTSSLMVYMNQHHIKPYFDK